MVRGSCGVAWCARPDRQVTEMVVLNEMLDYRDEEVLCEGHIAFDTLSRAKRPCVLIAHAWDGPNEQVRARASDLARAGYPMPAATGS